MIKKRPKTKKGIFSRNLIDSNDDGALIATNTNELVDWANSTSGQLRQQNHTWTESEKNFISSTGTSLIRILLYRVKGI